MFDKILNIEETLWITKGENMRFPVYIHLFGVYINPHPLFESLAFMIGFQLYLKLKRPNHIPENKAIGVLIGAIIGGILGSIILASLENIFLLWHSIEQGEWDFLIQGKTIVGGLLGGLIGVELVKKWLGHRESTGDDMAIPLAVGIMIGRVGCFLAGMEDRTYGTATDSWVGIDFGDGITRHPTQLYEIFFLLLLTFLLNRIQKKKPWEGFVFQLFMISYLSFRWGIEWIKPISKPYVEMSAIQWACILGILYYSLLLLKKKKQRDGGMGYA